MGRRDLSVPDAGANHTYTGDLVGPSGTVYNLKRSGGIGSADGVHQSFPVNTSDSWTLTF